MTEPSGPANPGPEQRRAVRRRVLQTGMIAYNDLAISFRCAIRDRSDDGARLRLPVSMVVPIQFWFIDLTAGEAFEAVTAWRNYPEIGVALSGRQDLKAPPTSLLHRRLHALWIATTS